MKLEALICTGVSEWASTPGWRCCVSLSYRTTGCSVVVPGGWTLAGCVELPVKGSSQTKSQSPQTALLSSASCCLVSMVNCICRESKLCHFLVSQSTGWGTNRSCSGFYPNYCLTCDLNHLDSPGISSQFGFLEAALLVSAGQLMDCSFSGTLVRICCFVHV